MPRVSGWSRRAARVTASIAAIMAATQSPLDAKRGLRNESNELKGEATGRYRKRTAGGPPANGREVKHSTPLIVGLERLSLRILPAVYLSGMGNGPPREPSWTRQRGLTREDRSALCPVSLVE
jgi:hypothetical protein